VSTPEPGPATRDVDLAEFQKLRDEIMARTQLVNTLVGVELAALGAGISSFTSIPDVLIGLAAVSSFLWLLWLDHAEQVQKIAAYIALRLRPRLTVGSDQVLRWETYMRQLDREAKMPHTQAVSNYIAGLFAGGPLVLLTIYGLVVSDRFEDGSFPQVARFVGLGVAVLLWVVTLRQYRVFRGVVATIERAIVEAREDVASPLAEEAAQP
jgi:hypothetical protein